MKDMKGLRVAYLALSEDYGGNDAGFVHTHSIVYALAGLGLNVRLFIGAPIGVESDYHVKPDVDAVFVTLPRFSNIFRVSPLRFFREFSRVRKMVRDSDIVHERFHVNPIDLLFVGRRGRRRYVLEVNDPAIELAHGLRKLIYQWLVRMKYNRADAIVVQTETLKGIVSRHTSTPIFVVPNGVDVARFEPERSRAGFRKKHSISTDEVVVTFVGSFREWHGVLDVVEMARRLPDIRFLMVGSGKLFDEVRALASGVPNLLLTGAVPYDDVPGIMDESDIMIAPFNTRGFPELDCFGFWWCPVKLFEYMASGKPVVSYDFPEVRRIVGEGGGLLAKVGDLDGFVENVRRLAKSKKLRDETGHRNLEFSRRTYPWVNRAREICGVYDYVARK